MAAVFLNQHLRPSISRQEYQPVFGSPGTLRQSIAHAGALASQQQRRDGITMLFVTRFTRPLFRQRSGMGVGWPSKRRLLPIAAAIMRAISAPSPAAKSTPPDSGAPEGTAFW